MIKHFCAVCRKFEKTKVCYYINLTIGKTILHYEVLHLCKKCAPKIDYMNFESEIF